MIAAYHQLRDLLGWASLLAITVPWEHITSVLTVEQGHSLRCVGVGFAHAHWQDVDYFDYCQACQSKRALGNRYSHVCVLQVIVI